MKYDIFGIKRFTRVINISDTIWLYICVSPSFQNDVKLDKLIKLLHSLGHCAVTYPLINTSTYLSTHSCTQPPTHGCTYTHSAPEQMGEQLQSERPALFSQEPAADGEHWLKSSLSSDPSSLELSRRHRGWWRCRGEVPVGCDTMCPQVKRTQTNGSMMTVSHVKRFSIRIHVITLVGSCIYGKWSFVFMSAAEINLGNICSVCGLFQTGLYLLPRRIQTCQMS